MSSRIPWRELIRGAIDLGVILIGAALAERQKPAAPTRTASTPQPRPPEPSFPDRADASITARGHAGIDERFRTAPAPPPSQPTPLPGAALHGHEPPDADPTEPDALTIPPPVLEPRDLQ